MLQSQVLDSRIFFISKYIFVQSSAFGKLCSSVHKKSKGIEVTLNIVYTRECDKQHISKLCFRTAHISHGCHFVSGETTNIYSSQISNITIEGS